jgi:type I restriction enzyme S subunit
MNPSLGRDLPVPFKVTPRDLENPGLQRTHASLPPAWPDDWELVTFNEAVSVAEGQVNPTEEPYASMPHVGPESVESGTGRLLIRQTARELGLRSGKYLFRPGDIVYSKIRPYLRKSILADFRGVCSADMYPLTARSGFDAGYLNALILSDAFTAQAVAQQDRTGIPKLNREQLRNILVPQPPITEQRRIAAVVWKIQTRLGTQDRIVTTLRELKAATMAKLFREGLRGEPLKQTEIGEIPESWEVGRLGGYCEKPQYGYTESARVDPVGPRFLRITDISEYGVDWESVPYCPCSPEDLQALRLRSGDLLFARIGATTGKSYLVTECPEAVFASYLIRIRVKERLSPAFLACFFETNSYWRQVRANEGTNVKGGMNASILSSLVCPIPSMDEQEEIATTLKRAEMQMVRAVRRMALLRSLFDSALRLLVTGQVRVGGEGRVEGNDVVLREGNDRELSNTIHGFLTDLVRRFDPDRVILFAVPVPGSPKVRSDVGLLVEMPFRGLARDQAARIAREIPHDFTVDLLVRRPEELRRAREIGDRYLGGILEKGRVLYTRPPDAPARPPVEAEAPRRPPRALEEGTLRAIVRRVVESVQPERIVLFGSAARGEMGPDSDVDLLVVKACPDRRAVARTIREALMGVAPGLPKDIIVVTPEDVERDRDTIGYIIRPALREGRVLYAA